jgi:acetyl/propionyl-CoA carboxylase alpha subunit/acetyl-CoA carboxylase carboxyltransferase component
LSAGGGGKGMYIVYKEDEMDTAIESCCRIGKDLYNDSRFYIEKYIERPVHIEVQVFNGTAVGIRKCAVQRRNQKIIEESGHTFLEDHMALSFLAAAERIAIVSGYSTCGAGTVEFLIDAASGKFGFMEMNTRLQVEYGVTDQSLGIDIAKWQILYFDGRGNEIYGLDRIKFRTEDRNHSIECRIYAEEPENDYRPAPGIILEIDIPTFNGIRSDFGFAEGDKILSMYDPMIGKLIAHGADREEAVIRMERALQELYIKGVKTNINQLLRIVRHKEFVNPHYTNSILPDNPELNFEQPEIDLEINMNPKTNQHIMFGAFAEYIKYLHQSVHDFVAVAQVEGVLDNPNVAKVPFKYIVEYKGQQYMIEFLQVSLDTFHAYINGIYNGKIVLGAFNDRDDDFLVIFKNNSKRIRVDRQVGCIVLRMRDEYNKINYFRMQITPEGLDDVDSEGVVCSPFQGSFVSFSKHNLKIGDRVEEGDALMILSAMKMETVIEAPVSGKVTYIIENGEMDKLQIAKTLDGRIIGKSLQEGEVLVRIEPEKNEGISEDIAEHSFDLRTSYPVTNNAYDILFRDEYEEIFLKNPAEHFEELVRLFAACMHGFVEQPYVVEKLSTVMEKLSEQTWKELLKDEAKTHVINAILLHYTYIKRLFSPEVSSEGFSFPEELDYFIQIWQNQDVELSPSFDTLLHYLYTSYGMDNWTARTVEKQMYIRHLFLLFRKSYQFCQSYWKRVSGQVHIVGSLSSESEETFITLKKIMAHSLTQLDDSSSKIIRKIITDNYPDKTIDPYSDKIKEKLQSSVDSKICSLENLTYTCKESISHPEKNLIPKNMPGWLEETLQKKIAILEKEYTIERLASQVLNIIVFRLQSKENVSKRHYAALSFIEFEGNIGHLEITMAATQNAATIISGYQCIEELTGNWIEVIVHNKDFLWDVDKKGKDIFDYHDLKQICSPAMQALGARTIDWGILEGTTFYPFNNVTREKQIIFKRKDDDIVLGIFHKNDKNNPYCSETEINPKNQRMFDNDKWIIELWAEECFDPGTIEEIKIPSIDTDDAVGSKIFKGTIGGITACFYMKDFRIIGGATGDREGRKYAAAAYIAFMHGWPLYVWNDSAGANIKQGVVSLNRGGEGFMMNSLLAEKVDVETFLHYTSHTEDSQLRELFQELNNSFKLLEIGDNREPNSMLVTVGIGASAGLDVYGSSQATIQIMLDSESSYRVLTGSNVIKSVLGEDISNYEIGGEKILGKWTGIDDIVASDKLYLISKIHQLHRLFSIEKTLSAINRPKDLLEEETSRYGSLVLSESVIKNNVDDGEFMPFKKKYFGSNALIAGFAKIAGRRVCILGPRTNAGLRSSASIIKAREIIKEAYRTETPQIMIFGEKWQQMPHSHTGRSMQSRIDFMNALNQRKGLRINIITNAHGLKSYDINSAADVLIFVKGEHISDYDLGFVEKNATFVVDSMYEAFDLSARIIDLMQPSLMSDENALTEGEVKVPDDPAEPYEIVTSVIEPVFDVGSFVEFYKNMNQPAGPNLVTGLAKLNTKTVGIIADQPQIKGGGADAPGTEKFRIFTQFLNQNNIPLVMLSNSSGFVPGTQQERLRIQSIGAESLDANILGNIPVVSVVLNQVYGGRQIQAFSKFLRPGIVYIARENALMAVMGATAAFDLLGRKKYKKLLDEGNKKEAEAMVKEFTESFLEKAKAKNDAMQTGILDWTFADIKLLRDEILKAMDLAFTRCKESFGVE